jgi:5-deoxy-5-amino-3-dehydroquinate synthase
MRSVVLVGLMGSGKSTVGRRLAVRTGRAFVDLDAVIERRSGKSIPQIFHDETEAGFRSRETGALLEVLAENQPIVLATGGGLVVSEANRRALELADATVVFLNGSPEVLADRIGADANRPLLGDDPAEALTHLQRERQNLYMAVADATVSVDRHALPAIVDLVARAVGARDVTSGPVYYEPVDVGGGRSYMVHIGNGVRHQLAEVIPERARKAAIITQEHLRWSVDPGVEHRRFDIPDGESAKTLETVSSIASSMAQWGMTRGDVVVGVGGGVVTDLAGFVASVYHRGIEVVQVSTTLLGQIDASVGGKCGVNLPEGKNLVGSFWQPAAVLCDIETLSTLPKAEHDSGMGELAKYHFLGGGRLDELELAARVAACVRLKADVVAEDETETGRRAILNYGHTLAHALETATNYQLRHGSAVAIGLPYAAELARRLGRIDEGAVAEHFRVLDAYGLDTSLPAGVNPEQLVDLFSRDKKAVDGVTFVLDGPNGVEPVRIDDRELLLSAFSVYER